MNEVIGEQIGSYRITGTLGTGGMGTVYLGEHPLIGQRVAIKVLLPKLSGDREVVGRFFNEARAAAMINHPGIIRIFDVGHHALTGSAYLVMEYVDGETLGQRVARVGPLGEAEIRRIGRLIAGALAAAHAKGIIHRDLKPDNVFVVSDPEATGGERVKIVDFGVAKLTAHHGASSVRTKSGMVVGSPAYMAPEQCQGSSRVDARADVYALGSVLLELAAGRSPFAGQAPFDIIAQKLYQPPPAPRAWAPDISPALEAILARATARQRDDRFASMRELADALAGGPVPVPEPAPARPKRRLVWAAVGTALLVGAGAGVVLSRGLGEPPAATLSIASAPDGAAVYRVADGVRLGTTPFARPYPRGPGAMDFVLKLDGYRDAPVSLSTERDGAVTVTMEPR